MNRTRPLLGTVLVCVFSVACMQSDHPLMPYESHTPPDLQDGWVISSPQAEGVDGAGLEMLYRELHADATYWQMRSLLVFRNGRLVAESYFKDADDIHRLHPIWSSTKQVVGLLAGQALAEGAITSLEDPISEYLGAEVAENPDKGGIRLRDLLTMRSGIGFSDTDGEAGTVLANGHEGALDYILSRPLWTDPGSQFNYNSGDPHVVMAAIDRRLSIPARQWVDQTLFSPIGLTDYTWAEADGVPFGGWGISTTPRHLARVGQLIMDHGRWGGAQVVDSAWIDTMLAPHVTDVVQGEGSPRYDFGYLSWARPDMQAYYASGSGGQFIVMLPELDLMVVGTSQHDTDGALELGDREAFDLATRISAMVAR